MSMECLGTMRLRISHCLSIQPSVKIKIGMCLSELAKNSVLMAVGQSLRLVPVLTPADSVVLDRSLPLAGSPFPVCQLRRLDYIHHCQSIFKQQNFFSSKV